MTFFKFMMERAKNTDNKDAVWNFCDTIYLAAVMGLISPTFSGNRVEWSAYLEVDKSPGFRDIFEKTYTEYENSISNR